MLAYLAGLKLPVREQTLAVEKDWYEIPLKTEIDDARKVVKTDKLQLSLGEIVTMYKSDELNIRPEFQRLFRWSPEKKSNLIESILIDIPIPPIFTYENEDGSWELVDGLQRVSTILEFLGVLKDFDSGELLPPSILEKTTYLPSLANAVWELSDRIVCVPLDKQSALEKPQQLAIRRARLDVQVLKQPSDSETKFHLFQRLNRGGAYANEQEIRTCAMVMVNPEFVKTVKRLAADTKFREMTSIKEEAVKRQKDIEYIVRLLVHSYRDYDNKSDVEEFLDAQIIEVMKRESIQEFETRFRFVIDNLYKLYGAKALFPNAGSEGGAGIRFSLRALEAVLVGVLRNARAILELPDADGFISRQLLAFWKQPEVEMMSASGLRGTQRLQRTIPFGDRWFSPNHQT